MFKNLKIKDILYILFSLILILLFVVTLVLVSISNIDNLYKIPILILLTVLPFVISIFMWSFFIKLKKQSYSIKNSINLYMENIVSDFGLGIVVLSPLNKIIWGSEFIIARFGKKIISKDISFFIRDENFIEKNTNYEKIVEIDKFFYQIKYVAKTLTIVVRDITQEYEANNFYKVEKFVIGEIDIDNFQQFQTSFTEEENFQIQNSIFNFLENMSKKYNLAFRQYVNSKFLIITNKLNLDKMIETNFSDFEELKSKMMIKNTRITLSVGFGTDSTSLSKLMEMAKEGLQQSQTRGGDQIVIISETEKPEYFGSKSEISSLKSRTKIKLVSESFKNKLKDSDIENVIIYGHKYADLDAIGASYALYEIAKSYGKKAYIQNMTYDDTTLKAMNKWIKNKDDIFINPSKANFISSKGNTMIIIVDCATEDRVENDKLFAKIKTENIFIFDHHRVSKINSAVDELRTYIESTSSSTCEIITELIIFNNYSKILSLSAKQMLLNGIALDTNQFKKSTSSRTLIAAAMLEEWGAKIEESVNALKITDVNDKLIKEILSNLREVIPGYWLTTFNNEVSTDIVSIAADEILKIEGRKAAFVIAKQNKINKGENDTFKLSARSNGVNVQIIAEAVGGGGHFSSAAAISDEKSNESLETFTDNIIQAIISNKQ